MNLGFMSNYYINLTEVIVNTCAACVSFRVEKMSIDTWLST